MDISEVLPSTRDSLPQSRGNNPLQYHTKTRTIDFSRKKQARADRIRHSSKPTDSTSTLIDNTEISNSLNAYKLKLSLRAIYETNPADKLKEIFSGNYKTPKAATKVRLKHMSNTSARKRRYKVDSIFEENEAELIREELNNIKNPKIWHQVIQNFKQSPTVLLDLIPIE